MKNLLSIALLLLVATLLTTQIPATAQSKSDNKAVQDSTKKKKERTVILNGRTIDSFTKTDLKAFITVLTTDSVVVDTTTASVWDRKSYYELYVPARPSKYILKAEYEGYEPGYINYEIKYIARNREFELPPIELKRKMEEDTTSWENEMEGVTVTGTRVKVIHKGDTIVFNAAAFKLPEGSMLDGLVRQMPGVELKDNGDIYVNGKKVDYLTLNGEDFFKGNNKMMLENLPYYTVQNVQVYNKETDMSRMTGVQTEKKDYVMDVRLKREYNRSYLGNIEMAGGTKDRYMGRLFGLYFDDQKQFTIFGNVNNVNENRRPGSEGEWKPSDQPEGLKTTRLFGFNFNVSDKDKNIKEKIEADIEWGNTLEKQRSASEQFTTNNNNIYTRSDAKQDWDRLRVNINNTFQLVKTVSIYSYTNFRYYKYDNLSNNRYALFSEDISRFGTTQNILDSLFATRKPQFQQYVVNSQLSQPKSDYHQLSGSTRNMITKKLAWGDDIIISLGGSFERTKTKNFTLYNAEYPQLGTADNRNTYSNAPQNQYDYSVTMGYIVPFNNGLHINTHVSYNQQQTSTTSEWYRLDRLGGKWSEAGGNSIGKLPSTRDSLLMALETNTSYNYNKMVRGFTEGIEIGYTNDSKNAYKQVNITLPLSQNRERMRYQGNTTDTLMNRRYTEFKPSLYTYISWNNWQNMVYGYYNIDINRPELYMMVPLTDDRVASSVRLRNPMMRKTVTHSYVTYMMFRENKLNRYISFYISGSITHGAFGTRTLYLPSTGTYIYQNGNVNGNWSISPSVNIGGNIDNKKRWNIDNQIETNINHSVDFDIITIDEKQLPDFSKDGKIDYAHLLSSQPDIFSKVNSTSISDRIKITYSKGNFEASAVGKYMWRHSSSSRTGFLTINARDFSYGFTLKYKLPLDIQLATDMNMFSRRGYQTAEMNTNDLIWNASLTRPFFKGKLVCTLEGFDLLHQLSSTSYVVNAQGRTETWKNTIPSYAMLHIVYKFSKK